MRITITGADGMLGKALMTRLAEQSPVGLVEPEFKLEDRAGVADAIRESRPDWVVHTAALTDVDGCESNADRAFRVNALGTRNIALACAEIGAGMVYVSTDFVFGSCSAPVPIEAWEQPTPVSVYGKSKWAGERYVETLLSRFMIVRTAWLYGEGGRHFVGTILGLIREGKPLRVVNDQRGSPSYAPDVAEGIDRLLNVGTPGWYHVVNKGEASWFDLAGHAAAFAGLDPAMVSPCATKDFPRPARRPDYSVLSTLTLGETTGWLPRSWQDALKDFLSHNDPVQAE